MWLSKVILVCVLALAACGFTPAYAPGGAAAGLQNTIEAAEPRSKPAFDLVERLEERLGPPDVPLYALTYKIALKTEGLGISTDNAITRYNLLGTVDWQLARADGVKVTSGRAKSFASYSATGSTVAGLAAEEDAANRLMRILADQIVAQITATSAQWAGTP